MLLNISKNMERDIIKSYINSFNDCAYKAEDVEFWFARDIQDLLGYTNWRNFENVIDKAKMACEKAEVSIEEHFADSTRTVEMPNGGTKEINDIILSRYACYLIAQNGDSSKEPIAFAMNYFAIQTRKQEILEKRIEDWERLQARGKLSLSEKELSGLVYDRGVDQRGIATIRSRGDKALFGGNTTGQMKNRLGVPQNRALADFLPTITIKAKDFANEITVFNIKKDNYMSGEKRISDEHVKNNKAVRNILAQRGIKPEELSAEEDVKKLERRVKSDDKKILKDVKKDKK